MTERSILAAISGIDANQTYLDSIANNIANADTVGYKSSTVEFQDLLSEELSGGSGPPTSGNGGGVNPISVGSGVQVAGNDVDLQEGSLNQTGNPNDVMIQGSGFLVVDNNGAQQFTRDGALTTDANGNLTTATGGLVMGWTASASGAINSNAPVAPIKIPTGESVGAAATTELSLGGNLPAWSGSGTATPQTTTFDAYDSLGNAVPVTLTFTPVANTANEWTLTGSVPNPSSSTPTSLFGSSGVTVTFDPSTGEVKTVGSVTANSDGSFSLPVSNMPAGYSFPSTDTWNIDFPAPGSADQLTQYNASSSMTLAGDGHSAGTLSSYSIGSDGTITGTFSNGASLALGQIALASFTNPAGLVDDGDGSYSSSSNSGQPSIGTPGSGTRGTLLGGALEQSNVDLGTELTALITAQEAYEANTKVLTSTQQAVQSLESVA